MSSAVHIYDVPEVSDLDVAFGAKAALYLTRDQMGDDYYGGRNEFTKHAQRIFFQGGSLPPDGRQWKAGIDRVKAIRALNALLCSLEPKHEIKIGTVGFALSQWTEKQVTPHQAQRRKPKHRKAA